MGSIVSLGLGALELDWGKNSIVRNHSALFASGDRGEADYFYADGVAERKPAFVRALRSVVRRLDLLGYTLRDCQVIYERWMAEVMGTIPGPSPLTFDRFAHVLRHVNAAEVKLPEDDDYDLGEFVTRAIFADPEFTKTEPTLASLSRNHGTFFENLDPYVILRLLAGNPHNLDREVIWRYADVVEGGWVKEEDVYEGVPEADRVLVVTEGSSDGIILKRSLNLVAADIADFFEFVDMSENYPFTGTGNLVRFCQGLARIRIQNRTLVVLDNDTAGRDAFARIKALGLPPRMRATLLPDLAECRSVTTRGPSGEQKEDINGRAVSIEWFLDTAVPERREPVVRWTAYNAHQDAYQGELIDKEAYTRHFLECSRARATRSWPKLVQLWAQLLTTCTGRGDA